MRTAIFLAGIILLFSCSTSDKEQENNKTNQTDSIAEEIPFQTIEIPSFEYEDSINIISFFEQLYNNHLPIYKLIRKEEFEYFCKDNKIDSTNKDNIDQYHKLFFFHDLFTNISCANCSKYGALQIPYFWHWCNPNPRHEIIYIPHEKKLSEMAPGKKFGRYNSFADIDRPPSLYLGDLLTEEPKYYKTECDTFYTFGWCSEREMAFILLMELLGFEGKVVVDNNHSWSELITEFTGNNSETLTCIVSIDNTFDGFMFYEPVEDLKKEIWLNELTDGKLPKWYNDQAHSIAEINSVRQLYLTKHVSNRIENQTITYLKHILP